MSRIKSTFAALAEQGKKGLIPFITAGDPNPEQTVEFMHALAKGGADVIELGVPFSDPMADGPVIQRSSERALARGMSLKHVLADVKRFRETNTKTPVVLMGYANPIERMGTEAFAKAAQEAGVDEEHLFGISMAVREAAVNAVMHGNGGDAAKQITATFENTGSSLVFTVADQGKGLDPDTLPDPLAPENLLRGSGRGIFLIRSFMDEVHFRQLDPGTELTLIKHLETHS